MKERYDRVSFSDVDIWQNNAIATARNMGLLPHDEHLPLYNVRVAVSRKKNPIPGVYGYVLNCDDLNSASITVYEKNIINRVNPETFDIVGQTGMDRILIGYLSSKTLFGIPFDETKQDMDTRELAASIVQQRMAKYRGSFNENKNWKEFYENLPDIKSFDTHNLGYGVVLLDSKESKLKR